MDIDLSIFIFFIIHHCIILISSISSPQTLISHPYFRTGSYTTINSYLDNGLTSYLFTATISSPFNDLNFVRGPILSVSQMHYTLSPSQSLFLELNHNSTQYKPSFLINATLNSNAFISITINYMYFQYHGSNTKLFTPIFTINGPKVGPNVNFLTFNVPSSTINTAQTNIYQVWLTSFDISSAGTNNFDTYIRHFTILGPDTFHVQWGIYLSSSTFNYIKVSAFIADKSHFLATSLPGTTVATYKISPVVSVVNDQISYNSINLSLKESVMIGLLGFSLTGTEIDFNMSFLQNEINFKFGTIGNFYNISWTVFKALGCGSSTPYYNKNDNLCYDECGIGYYNNDNNIQDKKINKICQNCHQFCQSCFGGSKAQCFQCKDGYFLQGTICKQNCSSNFYKIENLKKCVQFCPNGYYSVQQLSNKKCQQCNQNCMICQSFQVCLLLKQQNQSNNIPQIVWGLMGIILFLILLLIVIGIICCCCFKAYLIAFMRRKSDEKQKRQIQSIQQHSSSNINNYNSQNLKGRQLNKSILTNVSKYNNGIQQTLQNCNIHDFDRKDIVFKDQEKDINQQLQKQNTHLNQKKLQKLKQQGTQSSNNNIKQNSYINNEYYSNLKNERRKYKYDQNIIYQYKPYHNTSQNINQNLQQHQQAYQETHKQIPQQKTQKIHVKKIHS